MSLNIKSRAVADTFVLQLLDEQGEPMFDQPEGAPDRVQLSITVYGPGSRAYAEASAARNTRLMKLAASKNQAKLTAEEQAKEVAQFLAACTVSLNGFDYEGATDGAAIRGMYADTSIGYIADQVQRAVGNWANFTKGSTKP